MAELIRLEGLDEVQRLLAALGPGLERVNQRSQDKMAYQVMMAVRDQAHSDIDRPTPMFVKSLRYKKYGIQVLAWQSKGAMIYASDFLGPGADQPTSAERLTGVLTVGGLQAGPKASEKTLMRHGVMGPDYVWVPAVGAPKDRYGNVPGSMISDMLTNMGYGFVQPTQDLKYALIDRPDGSTDGIYRKVGGEWVPFLWLVKRPTHAKRFSFYERADSEVAANFNEIIAWYLDDEISRGFAG